MSQTNSRPKTFVVTLRADIRDAATIHAYLKKHGLDPTNPSALATMSLGLLADLVKQRGFKTFTSTADALVYLQDQGVIDSDLRKQKNYRTIIDQLSNEDGIIQEVATARESRPTSHETTDTDLAAQVARRMAEFKTNKDALKNFPKGLIQDE